VPVCARVQFGQEGKQRGDGSLPEVPEDFQKNRAGWHGNLDRCTLMVRVTSRQPAVAVVRRAKILLAKTLLTMKAPPDAPKLPEQSVTRSCPIRLLVERFDGIDELESQVSILSSNPSCTERNIKRLQDQL